MDKPYEKYFDDAVKKLQEGMSILAAKTDELTQKGKIKLAILSMKKELEKSYSDLGKAVFDEITENNSTNILENSELQQKIDIIKELKAKLAAKNIEYENITYQEATNNDKKSESEADFV